MTLSLEDVQNVKGPLDEFLSPYPEPLFENTLLLTSNVGYLAFDNLVKGETAPLNAIGNAADSVEAQYDGAKIDADTARAGVQAASLNAELSELTQAQAYMTSVGIELSKLESYNPATKTLPPVTFSMPELDYVMSWYVSLTYEWNAAWPLWPYALPS